MRQNEQRIAYISRCLNGAEKRYLVTEKEVLAALWAMEKFRYFLELKEFTLVTDHKAMEELKNKKDFGSHRLHRWFERLENFHYSVKYRKGKENVVSDALSRGCTQDEGLDENAIFEIEKSHTNSYRVKSQDEYN